MYGINKLVKLWNTYAKYRPFLYRVQATFLRIICIEFEHGSVDSARSLCDRRQEVSLQDAVDVDIFFHSNERGPTTNSRNFGPRVSRSLPRMRHAVNTQQFVAAQRSDHDNCQWKDTRIPLMPAPKHPRHLR